MAGSIQEKENIKAGTTEVEISDLLKMVGSLLKDRLISINRVKVPALTFSFSQVTSDYWDAFWNGRTLPLKFIINGKVQKETFVARLGFAVTFVLIDSAWLIGKSGLWILRKIPLKWLNKLLLGVSIVCFVAIIWPWWVGLDPWLQVPKFEMETSWMSWLLGLSLATVPFSIRRFRKWEGAKWKLKRRDNDGSKNKSEM